MRKIAIVLVSLMTALTSYVPAQAFPTVAVSTVDKATDVQQVQYYDRRYVPRHERHYSDRYDRRDRYDRHHRYSDRRDYRRYDRHGRRHNNTGAIIGGLAAGAIIGGAIASQNRSGSDCTRYRSYRAYDNTYQPSSGPRRVCR